MFASLPISSVMEGVYSKFSRILYESLRGMRERGFQPFDCIGIVANPNPMQSNGGKARSHNVLSIDNFFLISYVNVNIIFLDDDADRDVNLV